MEMILNFKLS